MTEWNDMIDFKIDGVIAFVRPTILARLIRTLAHEFDERGFHRHDRRAGLVEAGLPVARRAFAFRMPSRLLTRA